MKLLIVAGGGGHFSAALSVIEKLPKEWEILLVGRKYAFEKDRTISFEYETAHRLGIPFYALTTGRFQRTFSSHTPFSLIKIPIGFFQAMKVLRKFRPTVLFSCGGYVSFPLAYAARMQSIPIVVHEQIMGAGLANKLVGKFAKRICISWAESKKYFPHEKTVLTGLPIKQAFFTHTETKTKTKKTPMILVTGGSGGAHEINVLIEQIVPSLLQKAYVVHQTGDARQYQDYEHLLELKKSLSLSDQERYTVMKFIDTNEISSLLSQADLVVSRSGINIVTELMYLGKPSLFIPLRHGQQNEQLTNALFAQKIGLSEVLDKEQLSADLLKDKIFEMLTHLSEYKKHAGEARKQINPKAPEKIIEVIKDVARENTT